MFAGVVLWDVRRTLNVFQYRRSAKLRVDLKRPQRRAHGVRRCLEEQVYCRYRVNVSTLHRFQAGLCLRRVLLLPVIVVVARTFWGCALLCCV